jgi:hypothetical protein
MAAKLMVNKTVKMTKQNRPEIQPHLHSAAHLHGEAAPPGVRWTEKAPAASRNSIRMAGWKGSELARKRQTADQHADP